MYKTNTERNKLILRLRKKGMWLKDIAKHPEVMALSKNKEKGIGVTAVHKIIKRGY